MKPAQAQLREVADVQLGIALRGADASRHDPTGTHQLVRIGDLSEDGSLRIAEPNLIRLDEVTAHRSGLRAGEVLLAARGTRMTAANYILVMLFVKYISDVIKDHRAAYLLEYKGDTICDPPAAPARFSSR